MLGSPFQAIKPSPVRFLSALAKASADGVDSHSLAMLLNLIAWALTLFAALIFLVGAVGFLCPSCLKRPDEKEPPSRWKFLLCAWLGPVFPGAIAIMIWLMESGV